MKRASMVALVASLAFGAPAAAQFRTVKPAPARWASLWVGGYTDLGRVEDEEGTWRFGSSFGGGAGVHWRLGQSLLAGADLSYTPADFESSDGVTVAEGDGRLISAMATGRLRYGGGGDLGFYLTGGAGTFIYDLPDLDRRDADLALLGGAGLEYKFHESRALFLEWGQLWTYHQSEGVENNRARHSHLRFGGRLGW
jgi:hypothetical protein